MKITESVAKQNMQFAKLWGKKQGTIEDYENISYTLESFGNMLELYALKPNRN